MDEWINGIPLSESRSDSRRDLAAADWLWLYTRRPGTGDVCGRAPQRVGTRGSRELPHGIGVDAGLRWVRDRRERSKSIDEMAPRRNIWTRLGSWAGTRQAEESPARWDAPTGSACTAVTFNRLSNSCSSSKESESERDRDTDLGDDRDDGEERD